MKKFELFRLAVKTLHIRQYIIVILGVCLSTLCVVTAGNAFADIQRQKSIPSELTAQGKTDLVTLQEVSQIPGVLAYTQTIEVPATLALSTYSQELPLVGLDAEYLNVPLLRGTLFPRGTNTPYLLLNEAALQAFRDKGGSRLSQELSSSILDRTCILSGGKPVRARICGIIKDDSPEPKGYLGLTAAKALTQAAVPEEGDAPAAASSVGSLRVRIQNVGFEQPVTDALQKLGYTAQSTDSTLSSVWESMTRELSYLLAAGLFVLLCSLLLLRSHNRLHQLAHTRQDDRLLLCGGIKTDVRFVSRIRDGLALFAGLAFGLLASVFVRELAASELVGISVFASPLHAFSLLFSVLLVAGAGLLYTLLQPRGGSKP